MKLSLLFIFTLFSQTGSASDGSFSLLYNEHDQLIMKQDNVITPLRFKKIIELEHNPEFRMQLSDLSGIPSQVIISKLKRQYQEKAKTVKKRRGHEERSMRKLSEKEKIKYVENQIPTREEIVKNSALILFAEIEKVATNKGVKLFSGCHVPAAKPNDSRGQIYKCMRESIQREIYLEKNEEVASNSGTHLVVSREGYNRKLPKSSRQLLSTRVKLDGGISLSSWEINALVDFYPNPEVLMKKGDNSFMNKLKDVLETIRGEAYIALIQSCNSKIYDEFPDNDMNYATMSWGYTKIASSNEDHFFPQNIMYYTKYHKKALDFAFLYKKISGEISSTFNNETISEKEKEVEVERLEGIQQTIKERMTLYESWAQHYLVDAFSSGHMRPPRYELSEKYLSFTAGQGTQSIHNSDSKNGLHATNALGNDWMTRGDSQHFKRGDRDKESFDLSLEIPSEAIAVSFKELEDAMKLRSPTDNREEITEITKGPFLATYYIPIMSEKQNTLTEDYVDIDDELKADKIDELVSVITPTVKKLSYIQGRSPKINLEEIIEEIPKLQRKQRLRGMELLIENIERSSIQDGKTKGYTFDKDAKKFNAQEEITMELPPDLKKDILAIDKDFKFSDKGNTFDRIPAALALQIIGAGHRLKCDELGACDRGDILKNMDKTSSVYKYFEGKKEIDERKINYINELKQEYIQLNDFRMANN